MRALILGVGGLRGAYDAGVAAALCRKLGNRYFDTIYMSSVGAFAGTFYAANQPDTIENTWRNYVSGSQLVDYTNLFKGKNVLNLEYLIEIFQTEKSFLDLDAVFQSGVKLRYVVENVSSGQAEYITPTRENIFKIMTAATAAPVIHSAVKVGLKEGMDGSLIDPAPLDKAIEDGHKEIVFIYNKEKGFKLSLAFRILTKIISFFIPRFTIGKQLRNMPSLYQRIEAMIRDHDEVFTIRPSQALNAHMLTRDKKTLNHLFDLGLKDGYKAAETLLNRKDLEPQVV